MKEEVVKNLAGVWYLATSEKNQPHVRPLDKVAMVGGEVYFGTANNKKMFTQIKKNPKVEVVALNNFGVYRFMAEAYPEADQAVAEEVFIKMGKPFDEKISVAVKLINIEKY